MKIEQVLEQVQPIVAERIHKFSDIPKWVEYFSTYIPPEKDELSNISLIFSKKVLEFSYFFIIENGLEDIEEALRKKAEKEKVKAGTMFWPLRVAVTGQVVSLPLFETMTVLGTEEVLRRIKICMS